MEINRINDADRFMMTDQRKETLKISPTIVLIDGEGNRTALLIEESGNLHLAFALITDNKGTEHAISAFGDSQDYALRALGNNIHRRYVMATTMQPSPNE